MTAKGSSLPNLLLNYLSHQRAFLPSRTATIPSEKLYNAEMRDARHVGHKAPAVTSCNHTGQHKKIEKEINQDHTYLAGSCLTACENSAVSWPHYCCGYQAGLLLEAVVHKGQKMAQHAQSQETAKQKCSSPMLKVRQQKFPQDY